MEEINFAKIEKKWQKKWEEEKAFEAREDSKKKKYYVLEQYPYPSGSGLHMGHAFVYTIGDVYARFKRMQGFNVLHPMGFDSFGLPAENAAIKAKSHPKKFTDDAIKNFKALMKRFGFSYDWGREVQSHDPGYYKWDQWIFLKMFEKGLAYRKKAPVNWCSKCNTVLANEQVHNGKCWRHEDNEVEIRHLEQWFFGITRYAEELNSGLDKLNEWPELIKRLQRNWIGKSYGTEIIFKINGKSWSIFTTRPDTIYGVTFMVVSAQHPELMGLVSDKQKKGVNAFLKKLRSVSEEEIDQLEKEGVFTGSYAEHPMTGEKIPIYAGNFVLAEYGSGMVMAVPSHDQRDFDFAKKYKIPVREVVSGGDEGKAYAGEGVLVNSGEFNDLKSSEAKERITRFLESKGLGKKKVNFRLRDWLVSRQRFWGTPIPIIYCEDCGIVPVPEKDLPVRLPDNIKFTDVENPLVKEDKFTKVKCPKCGKNGRRETDTMDTFVNSSWYYLRYCDSKNDKKIFSSEKANYWTPIDVYIGGKEHATMHDIYFRFYFKFLRDLGLLKHDEPALRLFTQGFIYGTDGRKMSKSYGNVVVPEDVASKYGADAIRFFLVSVASSDKDFNWSDSGVDSSWRFLNRVYRFALGLKKGDSSARLQHKVNKAVKEVKEDIENFRYNYAIIKIRGLFDVFESENSVGKKDFESFVKLISAFCPHLAEEIWESIGGKGLISLENWPEVDEGKIDNKIEEQEKALEGAVADIKNILGIVKDKTGKEPGEVYLYAIPKELGNYSEKEISERLGIKVKVYAVNDKKKYDPEGKAGKAKPGKPGIYVE